MAVHLSRKDILRWTDKLLRKIHRLGQKKKKKKKKRKKIVPRRAVWITVFLYQAGGAAGSKY